VGISACFSCALDFLNPLRSDQAIDARQNPHPSRAEGWGTRTSKTSETAGPSDLLGTLVAQASSLWVLVLARVNPPTGWKPALLKPGPPGGHSVL
jgi:hypothetical protein